jgi:hypothetical protein
MSKLSDIVQIKCVRIIVRELDKATIGKTVLHIFIYKGKYSKNRLLQNYWARKAQMYMKTFWQRTKYHGSESRDEPQPRKLFLHVLILVLSTSTQLTVERTEYRVSRTGTQLRAKYIWNLVNTGTSRYDSK